MKNWQTSGLLIVTPAAKKHYEDDEFFFKLGTTEVSVTHQSNATSRTRNSFNTLKSWHRRLACATRIFCNAAIRLLRLRLIKAEFDDSAFGGCLPLRGSQRGKPHSLHLRRNGINNLSINKLLRIIHNPNNRFFLHKLHRTLCTSNTPDSLQGIKDSQFP